MGNLGRPGYPATTDGTWPYTYNSCDVGTYPNQTWANGTGPEAALDATNSKSEYNFELSWLTGQKLSYVDVVPSPLPPFFRDLFFSGESKELTRLFFLSFPFPTLARSLAHSACTCPGEDHPGPSVTTGRGAPEIDVLEIERNKYGDGQVVSQSAQFAPFTQNYEYNNETEDEWWIYDETQSFANPYWGSAVQQAVSTLTYLPSTMFNGSGATYSTFGFEYWTDPSNPSEGFITWMANGEPSWRMGAGAVSADQGTGGTGVSQRLIPEEPMVRFLFRSLVLKRKELTFLSLVSDSPSS